MVIFYSYVSLPEGNIHVPPVGLTYVARVWSAMMKPPAIHPDSSAKRCASYLSYLASSVCCHWAYDYQWHSQKVPQERHFPENPAQPST